MSRLLILCYISLMMVSSSVQVAPIRAVLWRPTEEQPCRSGRFAKTTSKNTTKCVRCFLCPKGQQMNRNCGTHSNTECEDCPSGSFNDVRGGTCRPCGRCMPGTYIRRYCASTHDTKCRPCPKNRFNTVWDTEACDHCRRCKTNEIFIAKCQQNHDTQCGDCLLGYFRESITGNCLPCSPCPFFDLRRHVVKECQTALGIQHSDVCWPGVYDQIETKPITENNVELAVNENELKEPGDLLITSTVWVSVSSVAVVIAVGFLCFAFVTRMHRRRNGITNTIDSGSFTFEDHHQAVNENSEMSHTNAMTIHQFEGFILAPSASEIGNTCIDISDYSLTPTTDQSSTDLDHRFPDALCKSESVLDVLKNENDAGCFSLTVDPRVTEKKKKQRKRKKQTPPDVVYYNIPCNPQYFPQQMYVTL